ncbi:MAG: CrcB-like protein [Pseudonocardia sp.]|uniref:fluoride efflux transporter CrcB n=1 Tax=Pseudonocardia sp. TaxID=60912 RepID=UPI00263313AF|nr:fluoride efflux transporter CrcB [Pseudonocardia sp.]MCU1630813.1 CrcB-like protein [Pseudonocardia sp.]MDT7699669.1 fluoride exporter [Pseudonocardiales bacterium]HEV7471339.1 fluoride efflux transporter CrcB [Pseudonocardia sp.]
MPLSLPTSGEDEVFAPPRRVFEPLSGQLPAIGAVAVGGALGALARWAVGLALPGSPGAFPVGTFAINVVGAFVIGALLVVLTELSTPHPLLRPFVATGILGGFTTFSTYAVDAQRLLRDGHVGTAFGYLFGTLAAALLATWAGVALARAAGQGRHR